MRRGFMHRRKEQKKVKMWASVPDTLICANCGDKHQFEMPSEYNEFMTELYENGWLCKTCGKKFFDKE